MALGPPKFGPYFWGALHMACLSCRAPDKLKNFVENYPSILPCKNCGDHFQEVLDKYHVPETNNKDELFDWSVFIHNKVNEKLGKPTISTTDARNIWLNSPFDYTPIIVLIIFLTLILFKDRLLSIIK